MKNLLTKRNLSLFLAFVMLATSLVIYPTNNVNAAAKNKIVNYQKKDNYIFNVKNACTLLGHLQYSYTEDKKYIYINNIAVVAEASEVALDKITYSLSTVTFSNKDKKPVNKIKIKKPTGVYYRPTYLKNQVWGTMRVWNAKAKKDCIKIKKSEVGKYNITFAVSAFCSEAYFKNKVLRVSKNISLK